VLQKARWKIKKVNQITDLQYFPCINSFIDLGKISPINVVAVRPFRKSGFTNRTIIVGSAGPLSLSIPLKGGRGIRCRLDEVEIDYSADWQLNHYRTLSTCYGKSPFFYQFADELSALYSKKPTRLVDWNLDCYNWSAEKFGFPAAEMGKGSDTGGNLATPSILRDYRPTNYGSPEMGPFLKYVQVFESSIGFFPNVSILDFMFCEGPSVGFPFGEA